MLNKLLTILFYFVHDSFEIFIMFYVCFGFL